MGPGGSRGTEESRSKGVLTSRNKQQVCAFVLLFTALEFIAVVWVLKQGVKHSQQHAVTHSAQHLFIACRLRLPSGTTRQHKPVYT